MEIWKDIGGYGYKGRYQVSNTGKVRRIIASYRGRVRELKLTTRDKKNSEHLSVRLSDENGKVTSVYVHRLVAKAFIPNPNNLPNVCHKDDNPKNNKVSNLFWGTHQDNINDKMKKGRQARGESSGHSKLKNEQVLTILREYTGKRGEQTRLAEKFNVTPQAIWSLINKEIWKNVKKDLVV